MKRLFYLTFLALLAVSCKKEGEEATKDAELFLNTNAGSTWNYQEINASEGTPVVGQYSVVSTGTDTTIQNKKYHVYRYSFGGSKYLAKIDRDYYEYARFIDVGQAVERLYLKGGAALQTTWSEEFPVTVTGPVPISLRVKLTNQIVAIGSHTVSGTSYEGVIHVKTDITSPDLPKEAVVSDIHSYFAPDYGMVENRTRIQIDYLGLNSKVDLHTTLLSATLK